MTTPGQQLDLHHGDCLEVMPTLDAGSIDLTVTSPPYDNLRTYNDSLDWGEHVWKPVLENLYRLTKDGGVVVWIVGDATIKGSETGTSFKQALYAMECGFRLHDTMIYKREGPPLTHRRYEQKFEYMFVLSKGRPSSFNGIRSASKSAGKKRTATMRQDSDNLSSRSAKGHVQNTKLIGNVVEYAVGNQASTTDKAAHVHPAIFPESLARDHIISWSNPGATVFDPFLGSGTTGKMSIEQGRNFIGIEKDAEYFEIATKRINQTETPLLATA